MPMNFQLERVRHPRQLPKRPPGPNIVHSRPALRGPHRDPSRRRTPIRLPLKGTAPPRLVEQRRLMTSETGSYGLLLNRPHEHEHLTGLLRKPLPPKPITHRARTHPDNLSQGPIGRHPLQPLTPKCGQRANHRLEIRRARLTHRDTVLPSDTPPEHHPDSLLSTPRAASLFLSRAVQPCPFPSWTPPLDRQSQFDSRVEEKPLNSIQILALLLAVSVSLHIAFAAALLTRRTGATLATATLTAVGTALTVLGLYFAAVAAYS
ncbi:hypothetical protein Aple_070810 [Acrocarpospora pleiomorpha]|uniref:Uncharacterized protein n=1 Tax=Acrocarpospora pleiomorpha TaxID=90975 RepID=A0A5M3XT56_9ACTN|nr:hypothetical protein Aple_070810 [Acrocarpospora pleiomorpha]